MLSKTRQTWKLDGMNTLEYKTISRKYLPLYTNITVDIGTEEGLQPTAAPPPDKLAPNQADVQMKSSANNKEGHWGQFTRCFHSHRCGVLALEPVPVHVPVHTVVPHVYRDLRQWNWIPQACGEAAPPWFVWYQWFILSWMELEKLDSVSSYIYSAVVTGETFGCLRISIFGILAFFSWTLFGVFIICHLQSQCPKRAFQHLYSPNAK